MADEPRLLTRDAFREAVLARDGGRCVLCGAPAQDAHHIMERRLFGDGGYYLGNGASVCGVCHLRCESTEVSVEELREAAAIVRPVLPSHLYADQAYDKWGNPIVTRGGVERRLPGDLFDDASVQKVLGPVLHLFDRYVKYPRTYHLPWSAGMTDDDRMMPDLAGLAGREVVVTIKMDGENTSLYKDYLHARSLDSRDHPSRHWVKNLWSQIRHDIPDGWRVCAENLYAEHSIHYDALPSYLLGFSVWDGLSCLDWDETVEWLELLGITQVPVLYRGPFDQAVIEEAFSGYDTATTEGYVVRRVSAFHYRDFRRCVGKYVRADHVKTTKHWMRGQPLVRNGLRSDAAVD